MKNIKKCITANTSAIWQHAAYTKTFEQCSFSHAAPSVWNSLPHDIRHIQSAAAFKTALKTHLFKSYLC